MRASNDRSTVLALYALICAARDNGEALFNDVAVHYRTDYLKLLREEEFDAAPATPRVVLEPVTGPLVKALAWSAGARRVVTRLTHSTRSGRR